MLLTSIGAQLSFYAHMVNIGKAIGKTVANQFVFIDRKHALDTTSTTFKSVVITKAISRGVLSLETLRGVICEMVENPLQIEIIFKT